MAFCMWPMYNVTQEKGPKLLADGRLHVIKPQLFAPNVKQCTNIMLMVAFCMWFSPDITLCG